MLKKFFAKFFNNVDGQSKTITSAAFILGTTSILSGFLGIVRDRLLASTFGAGDDLDVYYAAFRIPDFIYMFLIAGALSGGFIPIFTSYLKNKDGHYEADRDAWRLVNNFLNIFFIALVFLCALFAIFAPGITVLLAPGFSPEKMALTVKLSRIIFLETMLLGISGVFSAVLQSFKRFLMYSLTSVVYNLGIIIGILFFAKYWGITGVAFGVVLGAFLHMAIQLPSILSAGYRYRPMFDFYHEGFFKILKLMAPRSLSLGISQLNYLAITVLASGLTAGSLAIFNFSYNIVTLPLGIIGASFAIAAFPVLCEAFNEKDWHKFRENFSATFRQILFLTVPVCGLLIVLRAQIIRVILGAGKFTWRDTILTIEALQFFALSLIFQSLSLLLIRAFLAREDSKTPLKAVLFGFFARIGIAFILSRGLGVGGLTFGFMLGDFLTFILLWVFLKLQIKKGLDEYKIAAASVKIFIASFLAASVAYLTLHLVAPAVNMQTGLGIAVQGFLAGLFGLAAYIFFSLYFKSQEMLDVWQVLVKRLPWRKPAPEILEPIDGIERK